jgi:hypothetical protein
MPRIARGQENTPINVNWFTRVLGEFTDMYSVDFRVFRIEEGLPGDQVFPSANWESVTAGGGHYDTGHYFAYDNAHACGWTPAAGSLLGTHRIQWRWKQYVSSDYETGAEDFEVVPQVTAGPTETYVYVEVADVRAMGIEDPPYTDEQVLDSILTWQSALERACRQWFHPRAMTMQFDGDDSDMAHFGVPIISVEHLKVNESSVALSPDLYRVYNRQFSGDRRNPKIALKRASFLSDSIATNWYRGTLKFLKGRQNQEVKGAFGFVEADGSPPRLIKRALLKLVVEKLTNPIYVPSGVTPPDPAQTIYAGVVISETTDGHQIQYGTSKFKDRLVGLSGLTQDAEILDIIKLYQAPLGIANTSQWSY